MTRALLILLALTGAAQAKCLPQTDMTPQGECGKPWPKGERLAQNFPAPKWNTYDRGSWTSEELARAKQSQDAPWVKPLSVCLTTGQPEDCGGYVFGYFGAVMPSR